ncbi:MAG TPA: hypothetical protein VJR92_07695 [Gemmatimonadaceae bacterium]|nr:hypothetical protein [Gemmatimonadaceae bacterium]
MRTGRVVVTALLGAAALATIALPKQRPDAPQVWSNTDLRVRSAYARLRTQLEYFRRADSRAIATAAEGTATRSGALYFAPTPPRAEGFTRRVRAVADAEASRMPRHDSGVRIVIAFAIDTQAVVAAEERIGRPSPTFSTDAFLPTSTDSSACVVVVRAHRASAFVPWDGARLQRGDYPVLGPCAWYGAYGMPGRGIAAWLDSTHHAALLSDHRRTVMKSYQSRPARPERGGLTLADWYGEPTTMLACVSKRASACEALLQKPIRYDQVRRLDVSTPGFAGSGRTLSDYENVHAGYVLAELERQLGADAFLAFWKSDLPFPEAFAAARGERLSTWFSRELAGTFTSYSPGPLPKARTAIALLVLIPGAIVLGLWGLRRREVFA